MCRYFETTYKVHYVCVPCRRSAKYPWDDATHLCTSCRAPLTFAGHDFAAPRRSDTSGWAAVAVVLAAGLRYEGFERCGCGREPKSRPRTRAQVNERMRIAARHPTVPIAEVLQSPDPYALGGNRSDPDRSAARPPRP